MKATPSYSSPKGGSRGCLCKDGKTYSKKCCDGSLQAQGIGNITGDGTWKYNSLILISNNYKHQFLWKQQKSFLN